MLVNLVSTQMKYMKKRISVTRTFLFIISFVRPCPVQRQPSHPKRLRLRAVPLRSVTSKLGRTGESEFTRARKVRVRGERKPRGSWGESGKGVPFSVNSLSPVLLSPVLPNLDVTHRRGTGRSLDPSLTSTIQ